MMEIIAIIFVLICSGVAAWYSRTPTKPLSLCGHFGWAISIAAIVLSTYWVLLRVGG